MGIVTSGIIAKVIDVAGNILDPSKKNQLEIALKEKEIELQKIIIENDKETEVARQKSLSVLFEKGGFPVLMWIFGFYLVIDIFLQLRGKTPIIVNQELVSFLKIAFTGVMAKQGYVKINKNKV
ncbi:hypothetical protein [Fusobacterium varium]|uniref:hypothetical protein n=1 Tax=Fusobacterium varium TaxID=856 RepID=UPI00241D5E6E|nr:hypothetical protein [Fusobacterium varium]